jgi:hypothetical protein
MSNTPNSAPLQPGVKPRVAAQSPNPIASRTPTDSGRQSVIFQRELDRASRSDPKRADERGETKETASNRRARGDIDEQEGRHGGSDHDGRPTVELPSDAMISAAFRTAKIIANQATSAPELPAEHLARMAAAIQELATNGATANYHLQLPLGSVLLQGAVLGRDASGHLAIQLIASGTLTPQQTAQLRSELIQRMEKKRLKISSVAVTSGQNEGPSHVAPRPANGLPLATT